MTTHTNVGDRIELLAMPDDPDALPPGVRGTVTRVNPVDLGGQRFTQLSVDWDAPHQHRTLMVSVPPDRVRVVERTRT